MRKHVLRYAPLLAGAVVLAGSLLRGPEARADQEVLEWVPLGTGLANHISVGPNDVPWVIGYSPNIAAVDVYYLTRQGAPGRLGTIPYWVDDDFTGMNIFVNLNGQPFATGPDGVIYADGQNYVWQELNGANPSNAMAPGGQGSWGQMGPGNVSSFVVGIEDAYGYPNVNWEEWVPIPGTWTDNGPTGSFQFWGSGCGWDCEYTGFVGEPDMSLWTQNVQIGWPNKPGWTSSGWSEMPGAGTILALFSDPPQGKLSVQNPWVINAEGYAYYWNSTYWQYVPTPEFVVSITDHHILGRSGMTYVWNGNSFGGGVAPGAAAWTPVLPAPKGVELKEIAWSQAVGAVYGVGTVGPSEIWAIDYYGHIYTAQWVRIAGPIY